MEIEEEDEHKQLYINIEEASVTNLVPSPESVLPHGEEN